MVVHANGKPKDYTINMHAAGMKSCLENAVRTAGAGENPAPAAVNPHLSAQADKQMIRELSRPLIML
jgi:hypothetical protein